MQYRTIFTIAVFVAVLALVIWRPRRWPEAVWTTLGAALLFAVGAIDVADARAIAELAGPTVAFLLALLFLAALVEESGFFEWAARQAARRADGDSRRLFRNVFLLGAVVTMSLSLDTTAVMLTPIVLALVRRAQLPARPFVLACVFVANVASLLLPVSNLTNLLVFDALHLSFGAYVLRMALPQLVALTVTYFLLRPVLPPRFIFADHVAVQNRAYFRATLVVLALVCVGYFVGPRIGLPLYAVAAAGGLLLALAGWATGALHVRVVRRVNWAIVPFVLGLLLVVRAVENLGVARWTIALLRHLPSGVLGNLCAGFGAALTANVTNNVPAALLARGAVVGVPLSAARGLAMLVGTNVGPNLLIVGSLATLLAIDRARADGGDAPTARDLLATGARVTPLVLLATLLALGSYGQ